MSQEFQRDYLICLPLPLAQLYQRAYNDKSAQSRHNNTFYLFEALIKLATAPLVAAYLHEAEQCDVRVTELNRLLVNLALPSLGQWVGMLRALAKHFGTRPDAAAHPVGHLWDQLNRPHRDRPGLLALFRRIKNGLDGEPAGDQICTLMQVIDALVPYRNAVFGHGAGRFESFYEQEMGPLLFPAANEILAEGMLDILGPRGSRLVHLAELRVLDEERVEVGLRELVGKDSARAAPLILSRTQAGTLVPDRVAVLWPGQPVPVRLDPLLVYREREMGDEVLFLNRDRNGRQVEYLSYTRGEPERDRDTAPALAALLGRVTGRKIGAEQLATLAQQTMAETPSLEFLISDLPPPAVRVLGDYEILAVIGRGGMGVVYLARQLSLGRLVALKMLPADLAGDELSLARFRREMRLLARCDHPHIVKVLASGTLPDARVYYAMEYVPGCDLEQVWRELSGVPGQGHASSLGGSTWARAVLSASRKQRQEMTPRPVPPADADPPPAEESLPVLPLPPLPELPSAEDDPGGYARRVAALVRDAALALQAIHDQQVVHRDVKPANLMLTPDGSRVVLLDFGLAKGQSLSLSASKAGGMLGTLRYAAPEQLTSASLKVGPAADVYGLGVTLWELLTRHRLFAEAEDDRQLETLVHNHDIPRLRAIDPSLDRDLEAIVARATERRVADRIATAGKLAEYLQLYLEGKSLPFLQLTRAERIRRWVRSNPTIAFLLVACATLLVAWILSVTVGLVGVTYQWRNAVAQRNRAEENFRYALEAADGMLTEVGDIDLAEVPQMESVRKTLLVKAKASYQKFLYQKGDDPRVRWGAGHAEARLGSVLEMLGDDAEAERAYLHAIDWLSPLAAAMPDSADYHRDLAYAYHGRGILRKKSNRSREAEIDLREAIQLRQALVDKSPGQADDQLALVDSRYRLATVLAPLKGRRREAVQAYREAVEAQEILVAQNPDRPALRATLGRYLNNQGELLSQERLDDAEKSFRKALALEEKLFQKSPTLLAPRWQLGRITNNLGALLLRMKDRQTEAEALLRRAQDLLQRLAADFPEVPQYRKELASVYSNLGEREEARNPDSHQEAAEDYRQALDLLGRLAGEFPESPEYRQKKSVASFQLKFSILSAKTPPLDAEREVQEALQEEEKLVAEFPDVPKYAFELGRHNYQVGRLLVERGNPTGAERYLEWANHRYRAVLMADPENPTYRSKLAEDLVWWAYALIAPNGRGDHARAADVAEKLPRLFPDDPQRHLEAATFLVECASAAARDTKLPEPQRQAGVSSYESRAMQILAQAVTRHVIRKANQLDIPELESLRERPDFQRLLNALKAVPVGSRGNVPRQSPALFPWI